MRIPFVIQTAVFLHILRRLEVIEEIRIEAIGHAATTIELRGEVELPFLERRLITGGDDSLKGIGEGLLAKRRRKHVLTLIVERITQGRLLHIGIAESSRKRPPAEDFHRSLYLHRLRITLCLALVESANIGEVIEINGIGGLVHINH